MQKDRKRLFISYAREDINAARRIYGSLLKNLKQFYDVWFDEECLKPGQNWKLEIAKAINRSDLFVALMSTNAISKRGTVQKELRQAMEVLETLPPDKIYLLPVRLDDCHPKHLTLSDIHWVDMFPDWGKGMTQLQKGIISEFLEKQEYSLIDVCQVIDKTVNFVSKHEFDICLTYHIDKSKYQVFGDTNQLEQVVLNILLNSMSFGTKKKPIEVDVYKMESSIFVKMAAQYL